MKRQMITTWLGLALLGAPACAQQPSQRGQPKVSSALASHRMSDKHILTLTFITKLKHFLSLNKANPLLNPQRPFISQGLRLGNREHTRTHR